MCGILGAYSKSQEHLPSNSKFLESLDLLEHRGPDSEGVFSFEKGMLGHKRLSIIDLTSASSQPFLDNNKDFALTYNGEIYNFLEIKKELGIDDDELISKGDTEIVLESFKKIGTESFKLLNGIFAFSILDKINNKAYLVRDRLGIKPLYYSAGKNTLIFSSEIKSLIHLEPSLRQINYDSIPEWSYYGTSLQDRTLFKKCKKLLPGHFLEIDLDTMKSILKPYWLPENVQIKKNVVQPENELRQLLEKSVKRQLVSDVPIGVFLSGGIDSSAITAFATKHSDRKIQTFSVGFDFEKGENELPKARQISKLFDTEHNELEVSGYDLIETIESLVRFHDSPFSDAANIPLFLLSKKINKEIKVVLQGDGGDELFGGYQRYNTLYFRNYWKRFIGLASWLHEFFPISKDFHRRKRYLSALNSKEDYLLMARLLTVDPESLDPIRIFDERILKKIQGKNYATAFREFDLRFSKFDIVQKMLYTDTQMILPDVFLEKVDRSTMAGSIESRVPFLDNELVDFALSLPSHQKIKGGTKKYLLKKALEGILPNEILYGPKTGFSVPFGFWLSETLKDYFYSKLNECSFSDNSYLNERVVKTLFKDFEDGSRDNSFILWKILNFMIWKTQYFEDESI